MQCMIDEEDFLELLMMYLKGYTRSKLELELFREMYSNSIDAGVFAGNTMTIAQIVGNDYTNNCMVIKKSNDAKLFKFLQEQAKENGCCDVSGFDYSKYRFMPSYIEAFNDKGVLVRF